MNVCVATLTLARADKHNAMSELMLDELTACSQTRSQRTKISALLFYLPRVRVSALVAISRGCVRRWIWIAGMRSGQAGKLAYMLQALDTLPQPLIGRIHGNAFGGGVGLASICDVAIGGQGGR